MTQVLNPRQVERLLRDIRIRRQLLGNSPVAVGEDHPESRERIRGDCSVHQVSPFGKQQPENQLRQRWRQVRFDL